MAYFGHLIVAKFDSWRRAIDFEIFVTNNTGKNGQKNHQKK